VAGRVLLAGGGICGRVEARRRKWQLGGGGADQPDPGTGWPHPVEIGPLRLPLTIHGTDPTPKCGGSADPRQARAARTLEASARTEAAPVGGAAAATDGARRRYAPHPLSSLRSRADPSLTDEPIAPQDVHGDMYSDNTNIAAGNSLISSSL
jgi:hypothetical protein